MPTRRTSTASRPSKKKSQSTEGAGISVRAKKVWVAFLASMTLVGGLLLMLDGRPVPRVDGLNLSPLAATTWGGGGTVDPVMMTRRPLDKQRWQAIVIHHSGSTFGSQETIEAEHQARNLKGLGHHFIIGNGKGMDDGQVHIGYRWLDQLPGAHAAGPNGDAYNLHAISVCLVGDGNRRPFTASQVSRLAALVESLQREFNIPAERVLLHSDIAQVQDPGRLFPVENFRQMATASAAN